jgi:hypothetical protein
MGLFDRNWGATRPARGSEAADLPTDDERALARYRYLLNTAPPEAIEQAHAEAFAQLTPEQRRLVLTRLAENVPAAERAQLEQAGATPQSLARVATRTEMRQPGALERIFGGRGAGAGVGFGGMLAGSLLGSIAGTVLGSAIAHEFFANDAHAGGDSALQEQDGSGFADAEHDPGNGDVGGDFDGGSFDV